VAQGVFTAAKIRYTFDLLLPFAFLPLLRPRILLIPLPIYALNMLSAYENQFSIVHHYNALIVPWLAVAAIEAVGDIVAGRGPIGRRIAASGQRPAASSPHGGTDRAALGTQHSALAAVFVGVM